MEGGCYCGTLQYIYLVSPGAHKKGAGNFNAGRDEALSRF